MPLVVRGDFILPSGDFQPYSSYAVNRVAPYFPAVMVLIAGLSLSAALSWWFFYDARRVDEARFEAAVTRVKSRLDERTARYALELEAFTARLADRETPTPELWQHQLDLLSPKGKLPGVMELGYFLNADLLPRAKVVKLASHPPKDADGSFVLPQIDPLPTLRSLHHWARHSNPSIDETGYWLEQGDIQKIWVGTWNGRTISSPKRVVAGENGERINAVCLFFPIFESDVVELMEQFPQIFHGHFYDYRFKALVVATIDWQAFLTSALGGENRLVSFTAFTKRNADLDSMMEGEDAEIKPPAQGRLERKIEWRFFRQTWELIFRPTDEFSELSPVYRAWFALLGGALLSLLTSGLVGVQIKARRSQERISEKLRRTLDELSDARQEREHLSYDLHDGTIQSLYGLQLGLSRSIDLTTKVSPSVASRLDDHRRTLNAVIEELRGFILRHETGGGPTGDLARVLDAVVQRLQPSTTIHFKTELSARAGERLHSDQAVHLANLAREALSNTLRHSGASHVTVRLRDTPTHVTLEVIDDGAGFEPLKSKGKGLGLGSMLARAEQSGGTLQIDSRPGNGTIVRVSVPVEPIASLCAKELP